jgi:hypothetical protein
VGRGINLEQLLERLAGTVELAGVVVRTTERLKDGALARLLACGPLEDDRRLRVMPALEQCLAPLQQRIGSLMLWLDRLGRRWLLGHAPIVARMSE